MIRFGGIIPAVASFPFEWNEYEQFTVRAKEPPYFFKDLGRIGCMFEDVVTDDNIYRAGQDRSCIFDEFDTVAI